MVLKVYKTHPAIVLPKFATEQAACFDIAMQGSGKSEYKGFGPFNSNVTRSYQGNLVIMPGERIMVPTGLIFDVPEGYSIRVHPRSGLSLKLGLVLANMEGVIDSDYVEETFILLTNISRNPVTIKDGERIAQAELVKSERYEIVETSDRPQLKTDRNGGFGSTGSVTLGEISAVVEKRGRGRPKKVVDNTTEIL